MIPDFILVGACLIGALAIGWWKLLPIFSKDLGEHRQQMRQLRRNQLQAKIAEKQLELDNRLEMRKRLDNFEAMAAISRTTSPNAVPRPAPRPHVHNWGRWEYEGQQKLTVSENNNKYTRTDVIQARTCKDCGGMEMQRVIGPGL